jgi:UDP-N-acetylglucosamine acyltransferase
VAPTAKVHPEAVVGPHCRIDEYCIIEQDVTLGAGCRLEPYVFIKRWTTLGDENQISAGTALGTDPFDKVFTGERSYLKIGHRNIIREHYTISRGTKPETETIIGNGNYIMSSGHIAHNCVVGDDTVVASGSLLAGYVELQSQAFISGCVVVHQFSKIGRLAMLGGLGRVNLDLPPFFLYTGLETRPNGLNLIGLRRAGFSASEIAALKKAYRLLYRSNLNLLEALAAIERECPTEHTLHLVQFCRRSKRGIAREHANPKTWRSAPAGGGKPGTTTEPS